MIRFPTVPQTAPRWGSSFTQVLGLAALRLWGWRITGEVPPHPKLVAIAAPHTSTLDVFLGLFTLLSLRVRVRWLGKHTIFWEPFGRFLRWMGGIPVDRTSPAALVDQVVALIDAEEHIILGLAPEGTRKKVTRWKTGFYRIALQGHVPIVPVALDYRRRSVTIGQPLWPSGDYEADLAVLHGHFSADMARHPDRY